VQKELQLNGFHLLPIELKHTSLLTSLPFHHRDPFDRLLIAQSLSEDLPIVTSDSIFERYGVKRIW
jgi:PIN domain nuclease of toxin-antitoxin system